MAPHTPPPARSAPGDPWRSSNSATTGIPHPEPAALLGTTVSVNRAQAERIYGMRELTRILTLTPRRTAQLRRLLLLHGDSGYTFRDLLALRAAGALLDAGASVRQIRQALDALRLRNPGLAAAPGRGAAGTGRRAAARPVRPREVRAAHRPDRARPRHDPVSRRQPRPRW